MAALASRPHSIGAKPRHRGLVAIQAMHGERLPVIKDVSINCGDGFGVAKPPFDHRGSAKAPSNARAR
jgi:hypothetical protein